MNFHFIALSVVTTILSSLEISDGANILLYIGAIASHSHRVSSQPLANKLAERGHNVTYLSPLPNPTSHPAIKEFCPNEVKGVNQAVLQQFGVVGLELRLRTKFANEILTGTALFDGSYVACNALLSSPELKPWMDQNEFDLVIIDGVVNECAFALAHVFKAKTMLFGPISSVMPWDPDVFGFPSESSWVPTMDNNYDGDSMNFYRRLLNFWTNLYWAWKWESFHMPRLDALVRETLDVPDMPPLVELVQDVGVYLLNQHYSDHYARSYPPFVIPVGGMHLQDGRKPLPPDMEKFIMGANDGFIYISFGSVIKISTIPPELIQTLFDGLKDLNLKFLWKWEGETPQNPPPNVMFQSWFPQQDILAHPKIKGYIMQGGQISVTQAICNGVPLIIFPVNGDQDIAAKRVRLVRNGLEMELSNVTSASLKENIEKLVYDPSYSEKAKTQARVCKDRVMSPLETAVWWTEYVLRHDSTDHLKPLSVRQSWVIHRSLDVITFICMAIFNLLTTAAIILYMAYRVWSAVFKSPSPKRKTM